MKIIDELREKVAGLLREPLLDEGCEIADVVISKYKKSTTLRLFVYCQNGVTIDECARLSRIVGNLIDGTDLFESGYTLEVSSPGLDRPLKTAQDFRFRIGEKVTVEFVDRAKKKVTGEIVAAVGDEIEFKNEAGSFKLELAEIERAKIIF